MAENTMITRAQKGSALSWAEADKNFRQGVGLQVTPQGSYESAPIVPTGGGKIQLTNGSATVIGVGTQFNAPGVLSLAYNYWLLVSDGNAWYYGQVDTIVSDTELLMSSWINVSANPHDILPAEFPGNAGAYDWYLHGVVTTDEESECSIALGHMVFERQQGGEPNICIGRYIFVSGVRNLCIGRAIECQEQSENVLLGANLVSTGGYASNRSILIGSNLKVYGVNCSATGSEVEVDDSHEDCRLLYSRSSKLMPGGAMVNVTALGFVGNPSVGAAGLINVLAAPNFWAQNMPVYADDAAAGAGGLLPNTFYKTPTGELRIKL